MNIRTKFSIDFQLDILSQFCTQTKSMRVEYIASVKYAHLRSTQWRQMLSVRQLCFAFNIVLSVNSHSPSIPSECLFVYVFVFLQNHLLKTNFNYIFISIKSIEEQKKTVFFCLFSWNETHTHRERGSKRVCQVFFLFVKFQ